MLIQTSYVCKTMTKKFAWINLWLCLAEEPTQNYSPCLKESKETRLNKTWDNRVRWRSEMQKMKVTQGKNCRPWGRNECVTNEPQRTSAGRLIACEQALLFGRGKSREAHFAYPNRRACSQATQKRLQSATIHLCQGNFQFNFFHWYYNLLYFWVVNNV